MERKKYLVAIPGTEAKVSLASSSRQAVTQRLANVCGRDRERIRLRVFDLERKGRLEQFALELPENISDSDELTELEIDTAYLLANTSGCEINNSNRFEFLHNARCALIDNGYKAFY